MWPASDDKVKGILKNYKYTSPIVTSCRIALLIIEYSSPLPSFTTLLLNAEKFRKILSKFNRNHKLQVWSVHSRTIVLHSLSVAEFQDISFKYSIFQFEAVLKMYLFWINYPNVKSNCTFSELHLLHLYILFECY